VRNFTDQTTMTSFITVSFDRLIAARETHKNRLLLSDLLAKRRKNANMLHS